MIITDGETQPCCLGQAEIFQGMGKYCIIIFAVVVVVTLHVVANKLVVYKDAAAMQQWFETATR